MPLLKIENLEFKFKTSKFTIIKKINLSVNKGDFLVILGPNGSGKSTLAKLLNGLLIPNCGKILVDGLDTTLKENLIKIRKKIGIVFQNPENQFVSSIVNEDVAFGPQNLGFNTNEIRSRVKYALSLVGMLEFENSMICELSGGQKQKIAIAGILAMTPEILVLDEPTSMLDPISRINLLHLLENLNKNEGITVILITHNSDEIFFSNRFLILVDGKIALEGQANDLLNMVQKFKELRIKIPQITEFNHELREKEIKISDDIRTPEECTREIIKLLNHKI